MRAAALGLGISLALLFPRNATAGESFVDSTRFAASGYDVVAYFSQPDTAAGVKGRRAFIANWNGATYAFASAENRDRFLAAPGSYAPQFDGHCAWAAGQGYKAPASPSVWRVVDGKLYLNYSREIGRRWAEDTRSQIRTGRANWRRLDAEPAAKGDAEDYDPKASPTP